MKILLHNRSMLPGAILTLVFASAAVISFFWVPYDITILNIADRMKSASLVHPLGTDQFGRDILSMIMVGARTSIAVALVAVGIGMLVGVVIPILCLLCPVESMQFPLSMVAAVCALVGLYSEEHTWVRAGQALPIS